jgi:tetratricopeptide (TPR) repeat protein
MKIYLYVFFTFFVSIMYAQDAEKLYKEGLQLKTDKKTALALENFKKAVALKTGYTDAQYEMGWCYNDLANYKEAIIILKEVRKSWSTIPKVYFELGYALAKDKQYDSAKLAFYKCLDLKPSYSDVYKQMAYLEYERSNYIEALVFFNKQLAISPDGGKNYIFWYRKGFCENAQKQYEPAIVSLQNALLYKPTYTNTYLELGFAKTKLKNDNYGAIAYFKEAIKLEPKNHISYNGIAEVYRDNIKNCDSALYWYDLTLGINLRERKANYGIAYCLNGKGQYKDAIPYLNTAVKEEPTYNAAFVELGYSHYKLQNWTDAEVNLKKAIQLAPDNHNAHYYLCTMYIAQKRKDDALREVEELNRLNSKYAVDLKVKILKL